MSGKVGAVCAPGVWAACLSLPVCGRGALAPSFLASAGHAAQPLRRPRAWLRPRVGTVSVRDPAESQGSGLHCWAALGSGAPCPWLAWSCGRQPDQDLLGVTRRVHHPQVQEAQEGLRRDAGHVKSVCPETKGRA